ncbi:MAG: hypothetical protein H0V17_22395 [Deltaproteobacteria bacterium]|nr:hypothetical protein [Deltaproteobacteria bacterium]
MSSDDARITALEAEVARLTADNARLRAAARDRAQPKTRLLRRGVPAWFVWAIAIALLGGGWLMATTLHLLAG